MLKHAATLPVLLEVNIFPRRRAAGFPEAGRDTGTLPFVASLGTWPFVASVTKQGSVPGAALAAGKRDLRSSLFCRHPWEITGTKLKEVNEKPAPAAVV